MENLQDTSIFEFNIDEETKSHLNGIAQWAKVNAIVGFVALGISVITTFIGIGKISSLSGSGSAFVGSAMLGIFISVIISLLLNITLISAASYLKKAVENTDQGSFEAGITKLAAYFKILGILFIIVLVIFVLALLVGIIVGATKSGF
jgi:hypothetical protein